jgi:lipoprotein-releasing system permease protein
MFELSLGLKYLVPRRARLSASLIAVLAVGVISLVVWLILLFLSITEGIEKAWVEKLTTLNAPLRITPTAHYYQSYYYQIDGMCESSHYTSKTLGSKRASPLSDPYDPIEEGELPFHFPRPDRDPLGALKDPVKGVTQILEEEGVTYQDFELSGALLRLQLVHPETASQGYLTQVSYLATIPDRAPSFSSLLVPLTEGDLNHQLRLSQRRLELSCQDAPTLTFAASALQSEVRIRELLSGVEIRQLKVVAPFWELPQKALPEKVPFKATLQHEGLLLDETGHVTIWREGDTLFSEGKKLSRETPLRAPGALLLDVIAPVEGLRYEVSTSLQGHRLRAQIALNQCEVSLADFNKLPSLQGKEVGVLLSKSLQTAGARVGDPGYLSYVIATSSASQEQRLPIVVAGFYDPGVLSIGNRCILVPPAVAETINASNSSFYLDKKESRGILVWFPSLSQTGALKSRIEQRLRELGLEQYWKVTPFYEYEFAKDLLEQFQSDKLLFMLVGVLILIVGCCNIISMLVLLVNDKKREIGILRAMGATPLSVATLFGGCGIVIGILSCGIGYGAALLTLHNIDSLLSLLSLFQGHTTLNPLFFGPLPQTLSQEALRFVMMATPLLALIAGLIPAIKASRLQPSTLLRT